MKRIHLQGKRSVEKISPEKQMNPRKKVNKDKIKIHYWENECSPLGRQIATSTTTLHCLHYPLNSGRDPSRYEIEIIKDA